MYPLRGRPAAHMFTPNNSRNGKKNAFPRNGTGWDRRLLVEGKIVLELRGTPKADIGDELAEWWGLAARIIHYWNVSFTFSPYEISTIHTMVELPEDELWVSGALGDELPLKANVVCICSYVYYVFP